MSEKKLHMKVSLGTIDDLGVKLYSGFPAALAELVANAWDADATRVDIDISDNKVVITDNGHGMSRNDIQKKYLTVGYRRRDHPGEEKTPEHRRAVMGRKGIGRLALFSIANQIKVHSVKNGEKIGLVLSYHGIQEAIKAIKEREVYFPQQIDKSEIEIDRGTKIELTDFRYKPKGLQQRLRERLSRRFSIIGDKYNFQVFVGEQEISVSDRNYYSKIQDLWTFGDEKKAEEIKNMCSSHKSHKHLGDEVTGDRNGKLSGWIGAPHYYKELKDDSGENLNNIVIMMRGRLAQEDILHSLGKGEVSAKYLIGEIHADYLDEDDKEDMATSGRQSLNQNDSRYQDIKDNIRRIVTKVCSEVHKHRSDKAFERALKNDNIKKWFANLSNDAKDMAKKLFSSTANIDDDNKRETLISCIVPAVERMSLINNLSALGKVSIEELEKFSDLFIRHDNVEAILYHQITDGRLKVIKKLSENIDKDAFEKVFQKHIYDHLWLLDPSWDRACVDKEIEKRVTNAWGEISDEPDTSRVDIKYKKTSGQHVIIELKRPSARGSQIREQKIIGQIKKYMASAKQMLIKHNEKDVNVEGIILLGEYPPEFSTYDDTMREKTIESFKVQGIKLMTYGEVINQASRQYSEYLEEQDKLGIINKTINEITNSIDQSTTNP